MEAYLLDVLNLLLRWLHMIAGIAWIGASFYFVMLDSSLTPSAKPEHKARGVFGELWAVHGGGFYHSQKYLTGPRNEALSDNLHWSKWEAYTTWMSGIALFALVYWVGAEIYLIDGNVMTLSQTVAIAISLAFIVGGWLVYNYLCRSPLASNDKALGLVIFALVSLSAWGLCQIFSGRGAYMTFGAMIGTIMVCNVFFVIIPGQKKMVSAIRAAEEVDPKPGLDGKQRSVHNTYFTLPVLFTMISNHYSMTFGHQYNWLILIAVCVIGALIRVFFVSRHGEGKPSYVSLAVALLVLLSLIVLLAPSEQAENLSEKRSSPVIPFTAVQTIIEERCTGCHSSTPTLAGFAVAPKGIVYDNATQITSQAQAIYQQAVATRVMPIANLSGMTEEERIILGDWYKQQADQP